MPNIGGFSCPLGDTFGPSGQALAHPTFRHPTDCQKYIICFFGKNINERGCMDGQIYDESQSKCILPEDLPTHSKSLDW